MKFLVYGAGIIGSLVASQLKKNGQDVTILARGQHAADLRSYGIVTHPFEGEEYFTTHPEVIEKLTKNDQFDVIFVILRRNHHQDILPILAKNEHYQKVIFLGNNLGGGKDILETIPEEKLLFGFGGTTGEKRGDIIYHYVDEETEQIGQIWLGSLDGQESAFLQELKTIIEDSGFAVEISTNINAWLMTHAAVVLPVAFGIYLCNGSNFQLARTRDAILLTYRGVKEGFKVLKKLNVPITPKKYKTMSMIPEPLAVAYLRKFFNSDFARVGLATHANNAKDEMYFLANEFKTLIQQAGIETPSLDQLYAMTEKEETQITIPEGSQAKRLDWKPIWIGASILTGILGAIGYLLTLRKRKK